jgi:hypothetical protein
VSTAAYFFDRPHAHEDVACCILIVVLPAAALSLPPKRRNILIIVGDDKYVVPSVQTTIYRDTPKYITGC